MGINTRDFGLCVIKKLAYSYVSICQGSICELTLQVLRLGQGCWKYMALSIECVSASLWLKMVAGEHFTAQNFVDG